MYIALEQVLAVVVALLLRQTLWTEWTKTSLEVILYPMLLAPFVLTVSQTMIDMPMWTEVIDVWVMLTLLIGLFVFVAMGRQHLHSITVCSALALGMLMHRVMVRIVPLVAYRLAFDAISSHFMWLAAYICLMALDMTYNGKVWTLGYAVWLLTEVYLVVLDTLSHDATPAALRELAPVCICVVQVLLFMAAVWHRPSIMDRRHESVRDDRDLPAGQFLYTAPVSMSSHDSKEMTAEFGGRNDAQ
jgi:hypothetical protein